MAIKTLCEAGLKVCAINAGRRLDPKKDFRNHRMPWDMKFRGFGDPAKRAESYGFMDNEWLEGVWNTRFRSRPRPAPSGCGHGVLQWAARPTSGVDPRRAS